MGGVHLPWHLRHRGGLPEVSGGEQVQDAALLKQRYVQDLAALSQENPLLAARIAHDVSTRGWDSVTQADVAQAGNYGPSIAAYLQSQHGAAHG